MNHDTAVRRSGRAAIRFIVQRYLNANADSLKALYPAMLPENLELVLADTLDRIEVSEHIEDLDIAAIEYLASNYPEGHVFPPFAPPNAGVSDEGGTLQWLEPLADGTEPNGGKTPMKTLACPVLGNNGADNTVSLWAPTGAFFYVNGVYTTGPRVFTTTVRIELRAVSAWSLPLGSARFWSYTPNLLA